MSDFSVSADPRAVAVNVPTNAPQETVFLQTRYPDGGPDTMIVPQEVAIKANNGEKSVMKYRTPY